MATLSLQVASGNDDGRQAGDGTITLDNATEVLMPSGSSGAWAAARFTGATIPPGSTIDSATLSLYIHSATYDDTDVTFFLDDADNSAALTTTANDFSSRAATTANVVWTATAVGTGWKSPGSLTAVVQEVVSRAGWASGNALTVLMDARTVSNNFRFRSYEYDPTLAAKLDITYTPPAGGVVALSKVASVRLATKVGNGLTR